MRVPLAGGTPELVVAMPTAPLGIVLDDASIYWMTSGSGGSLTQSPDAHGAIWKAPLLGHTPTRLAPGIDGGRFPSAIAIDRTSIYWVDKGSASIKKVSKEGGSTTTVIAIDALTRGAP